MLRQIRDQFRYQRHFPVQESAFEAGHGRQVRWDLRARNAGEAITERWSGASWIIELVSTGVRDGKPFRQIHHFLTTLRTSPKALLRLVRQRWAIENEWHWVRDVRLGEDAHHYAERNGVQVLALLRSLALNLLRTNGYRSIRDGQVAVSHDICRMLGWIGIRTAGAG
nr:ISAs1 family transposase [Vulcanococcus limneticus]